jgi:hypothetical protein
MGDFDTHDEVCPKVHKGGEDLLARPDGTYPRPVWEGIREFVGVWEQHAPRLPDYAKRAI